MKSEFYRIFITSFFLNAAIYSVHNFLGQIFEDSGVMNVRKTIGIQILYLFKFISSIASTNVCDRKKIHKQILGISILSYGIIIILLVHLSHVKNENLRYKFLICLTSLLYAFNGGTYPIMDSIMINYLKATENRITGVGKLKIGGSIGHLTINLILSGLHFIRENTNSYISKVSENTLNAYTCLIFAILTCFCAFSLNKTFESQSESKNNKVEKWSLKGFIKDFKSIFGVIFLIYSFAVLFQGVDRIGISNFLSNYLKTIEINKSSTHMLYLWRCLPEMVIYGLCSFLSKFVGLDFMFALAVAISSSRTFFYACYDLKNTNTILKYTCVYTTEFLKGFYSAFFHYSTMRIFTGFSNSRTVSTSQGILYSLYNSVPNIVFSMLQFFFDDTKHNKIEPDELRKIFFIVGCISVFSLIAPISRYLSEMQSKKQRKMA